MLVNDDNLALGQVEMFAILELVFILSVYTNFVFNSFLRETQVKMPHSVFMSKISSKQHWKFKFLFRLCSLIMTIKSLPKGDVRKLELVFILSVHANFVFNCLAGHCLYTYFATRTAK